MDPWYDILNGDGRPSGEVEDNSPPLLDIARFLQQMGVIDNFDNSGLAPAASKTAVDALIKEEVKEDSGVKCPICLRDLDEGDVQVTMPCKHPFHDQCILAWLKNTNSCPVCRFELPTDDARYEEQREAKKRQKVREENVRTLHGTMYS